MRRRRWAGREFFRPRVSDRAQERASGDGFESGLERDALLDLRTSSAAPVGGPGNFKRTAWLPGESFRVAGALPRNLSSMKISAPSRSEETVTVPTPSG